MKTRLAALNLLDRAFTAMTDDELSTLVGTLPDGHVETLDSITELLDPSDAEARITALRHTAARGRVNGGLEQVATVLTDPALAACIEALGDAAENPSEEQLLAATPPLVETYGVGAVRLMLASAVAGEAAASPMLIGLLKGDGEFGLPPVVARQMPVLVPKVADDDVKERRRAAKEAKKADARARREQASRAAHRR